MNKQNVVLQAENFLDNEKQYRLGFISVEKPNPKTAHMDLAFAKRISDGVRVLQSVDLDLPDFAQKALMDGRYTKLTDSFYHSLANRKRIIFSGCGSSGRLSILLEASYRKYFKHLKSKDPGIYESVADLADAVWSIMTGGDYAMIRAVEAFEDYAVFGRRQAGDFAICKGDTLVGVTATGETASILGTVMEAAESQADVFILICVPMASIAEMLDRSKQAFAHPQVTVLDMPCGGMALTGSTRMQSSTLEMFVAGAALETALIKLMKERLGDRFDGQLGGTEIRYAEAFRELTTSLTEDENVERIAQMIAYEEEIYKKSGLVTYFASDFLVDILTDTTERPPTFSLPPFRKCDENTMEPSWAFVKNPYVSTCDAWIDCLGREARCLSWKRRDYEQMGVSERITTVPVIDYEELLKFRIGNEPSPERTAVHPNAAIWIGHKEPDQAFIKSAKAYDRHTSLVIGSQQAAKGAAVRCNMPKTPLRLFEHIAMKLTLNVISTGVMVRLGRVTGNWMSWLNISNKKLIDRSIRIIADQCGISYRDACFALFETAEDLDRSGIQAVSPVQATIHRINQKN